jgi:hypothetical protein
MKKLLVTLAAVLISVSAFAQGTVTFNNRNLGDGTGTAPITLPDGSGAGSLAGAFAQLYLVSGGTQTAIGAPVPFRTGSAAATPYIQGPVDVTVTGVPAGTPATFRVRAWVGGNSYGDAANTFNGQSNDVTTGALGGTPPSGGTPITPPDLTGLAAFSLAAVTTPEPSTIALGVLGAAALLIRRRK